MGRRGVGSRGDGRLQRFHDFTGDVVLDDQHVVPRTIDSAVAAHVKRDVTRDGAAVAGGGASIAVTAATSLYPRRGTVAMYAGCFGSSPSTRRSDATA